VKIHHTAPSERDEVRVVDGDGQVSGRAWGTLLVLCGALFLDALDVSMMGIALPSIRSDLGMSTSSLQWVASSYALGFGGFLLLGGRAADLFGRRRVFLVALGVFVIASGLGGLAPDGTTLIACRFASGVAAAFTAPAALSIITTSYAEGPARTKALSIFSAAGASGFSLGLVAGGLLSDLSWRWVFFVPMLLALGALLGALRLIPDDGRPERGSGHFDLAGACSLSATMLLLVFTVVQAPQVGWGSLRTLGSLLGVAALLAGFVAVERRSQVPLVRLGILRSSSLIRANLGAMSLLGAYVGFQFIATLYMQQLRNWSPIEAGLAFLPGGLLIALLSPRLTPQLVNRFDVHRVILTGMSAATAGYALFLRVDLGSPYPTVVLPTIVLIGIAMTLAYGPLTIAATTGIAPEEQGLASGLVNTSFQFGGALTIALVTAVHNANVEPGASPTALLSGYRAALVVPLVVAVIGAVAAMHDARRPGHSDTDRSTTPA
jgi:MFS family permease